MSTVFFDMPCAKELAYLIVKNMKFKETFMVNNL